MQEKGRTGAPSLSPPCRVAAASRGSPVSLSSSPTSESGGRSTRRCQRSALCQPFRRTSPTSPQGGSVSCQGACRSKATTRSLWAICRSANSEARLEDHPHKWPRPGLICSHEAWGRGLDAAVTAQARWIQGVTRRERADTSRSRCAVFPHSAYGDVACAPSLTS